MINILGQPYLVLDQHVDTKTFDSIIDDIILGIARSRYAAGPANTGTGYLDKSKHSAFEIYRSILADSTHPYYEIVKNLKNWEPFTFIQYKWPSHVLGQCLLLRSSGIDAYESKHDPSYCRDHPIISNFTSFVNWLKSSNIFEFIGRIVIFLNETGSSVLEHQDYQDGVSKKDQFIWICPMGNKKFYVRDGDNKVYFNSRFCYFDNANIHGSDIIEQSSFSIRVDGKFSQSFLDKTNLKHHI